MRPKTPLFAAFAVTFFLPAISNAAVVHQFVNSSSPSTQRPVNHLDGQNGTDWSSAVNTGTTTSTWSDLSNIAPSGSVHRAGTGTVTGTPGSSDIGYLYSVGEGAARFSLTGTFSALNTTSVSWVMGHSSSSVSSYLLVQSGGNWYVSNNGYTTTGTTLDQFNGTVTGGGRITASANLSSLSWNTYDITTLTVGSAVGSLPSYNLTGIGFHNDHTATGTTTARFDDLMLIPEPTAVAMSAIGLLGLLRRRRA